MSSRERPLAGGAAARYLLLGSALLLTSIGLVMIYSASSVVSVSDRLGGSSQALKQLAAVGVGGLIAFGLSRLDYRVLKAQAMRLWVVSLGLLGFGLVAGLVSHGARRWIKIGSFQFQPSEIAKVAVVIALAAVACEWQRGKTPGKVLIGQAVVLGGIPAAAIIAQPDLGTTVMLVFGVLVVLVLAGIPFAWMLSAGAAVVALGVAFIFSAEYRLARLTGFLRPEDDPLGGGYQIIQALYAFGSGGIKGVGLGLSRQKYYYLPEAHNDFVFAVIGEEAGLIGTLLVVAVFAVFMWAGFRIAAGASDRFGRLLAGGLTGMLSIQAVINMAAATQLMPVTGKPLPFVSFGGSAMLGAMIALGLLLSVSEYGAMAPRAVKVRRMPEGGVREGTSERGRNSRSHLSRTGGGRASRRRA